MWKAASGALIVVVLLMLAGAGQASAQLPRLEYACTPAPSDCGGWYRAPVRLAWEWDNLHANPSPGADCATQHVQRRTQRGTRVFCQVQMTLERCTAIR